MSTITETVHYVGYGQDVTDSVDMVDVSEVYANALSFQMYGSPRSGLVSPDSTRNLHIQVVTTETVRKSGKYRTTVKSIKPPKCWCGSIAHYVRDASDAADFGFVCESHTTDFFANIVRIRP